MNSVDQESIRQIEGCNRAENGKKRRQALLYSVP